MIDTTRAVGTIPIQSSVTPTGAMTYTVPIKCLTISDLTPQISLVYNSQGGRGIAGYGWSIAGVSSITRINKTEYYNGESQGACIEEGIAAQFALDGVPLMPNPDIQTSPSFSLVSAYGHILVNPRVADDEVTGFDVSYPDGSTAEFYGGNGVTYPIMKRQSLRCFDNVCYYYESSPANASPPIITRILYGGSIGEQFLGRIDFEYGYSYDGTAFFFAGVQQIQNRLLTAIKVYGKSQALLHTYNLTHTELSGTNVLTSIGMTNYSGESLNPLRFEYAGVAPGAFFGTYIGPENSPSIKWTNVTDPSQYGFIRGHFSKRNFDDGLVYFSMVRDTLPDGQPGFSRKVRVLPSLSSPQDTLTVTVPFEAFLSVADMDSNGVDNLISIYLVPHPPAEGRVAANIQKDTFVETANGYTISTSTCMIDLPTGHMSSSGGVYPHMVQVGHVKDGSGSQVILVCYSNNDHVSSIISVIDFDTHTVLSDQSFIEIHPEDASDLVFADIDADGITEMLYIGDDGIDCYEYSSNGFTYKRTYGELTRDDLPEGRYEITDLNSDGYPDFVVCPSSGPGPFSTYWHVYYFTGIDFEESYFQFLGSGSLQDEHLFMDVDRDGYTDLVIKEGTTLNLYKNYRGGLSSSPLALTSVGTGTRLIAINPYFEEQPYSLLTLDTGHLCMYRVYKDVQCERSLVNAFDCLGNQQSNSYSRIINPSGGMSGYDWDETSQYNPAQGYYRAGYPIVCINHNYAYGSQGILEHSYEYKYYDAVFSNQGLGFCGFNRVERTDMVAYHGRYPYSDSRNDPTRQGVLTEAASGYLSGNLIDTVKSVNNSYSAYTNAQGLKEYRLLVSSESNHLSGTEINRSLTYYSTGLLKKEIVLYKSGQSSVRKEITQYNYSSIASPYILGLPTAISKISIGLAEQLPSLKERTVMTYNNVGLLSTKKEYRGDVPFSSATISVPTGYNNLVSETRYGYTGSSEPSSEKVALYGATTFLEKKRSYPGDFLLICSETDELGNITRFSSFNRFRQPCTITDARGNVTTIQYDSWGNETSRTFPDGHTEYKQVKWGGSGLYLTRTWSTGNAKPEKRIHYDSEGREVRTAQVRFDGSLLCRDKEYNAYGQVARTSLPFKESTGRLWNSCTYDSYGRPSTVTGAAGNVISWTYDGLTTTETKEGVTTQRTSDIKGNLIRAYDPGGIISYILRPDGQPHSISAPGGAITSFTYDKYGRRLTISDPSAGIQRDSTAYYSGGNHIVFHTDPTGTETISYDKFGRITNVQRPGKFQTFYTYNSFGQMTLESSDNGTCQQFSYDSLGRVLTFKETGADSIWFQKAYVYRQTDGRIASITYSSSQSGTITSEHFSYSRGHQTKSALPDSSLVFRLDAENGQGRPTSVKTASASRSYSYDSYGLPTRRGLFYYNLGPIAGTIYDESYTFNHQTGNMTGRTLQTLMTYYSESFTYDSMNRLTGATLSRSGQTNTWAVAYSGIGNPTSIASVGDLSYGNIGRPYQVSSLLPNGNAVKARPQSVSYYFSGRPSAILEGGRTASFVYNASGQRVKMALTDSTNASVLSRYYLGDQYEIDIRSSYSDGKPLEKLYLGGDYYSAPVVYVKEQVTGSTATVWRLYDIGRDVLGSIRSVSRTGDTPGSMPVVYRYNYDPWGRMIDFATPYPAGDEPETFLGRGFSGHEHLPWFGLVNMNARLYDPALGRFLSPDPFVQAPDNTQSFNRYSYALNNPLKNTDKTGEFWDLIIGAIIGGIINVASNWKTIEHAGFWTAAGYFALGAAVGALSAYGGSFLAGITKVAGVWGGAFIGAVGGAISGAATNSIMTIGNNFLSGNPWNQGLGKAVLKGALMGAISGAVSGAIQGYKFAKENGANPWTNKINESEKYYCAEVKTGVHTQPDPSKECYAYAAEYADSGHGNHLAEEFLAMNNNEPGGDFSILGDVDTNASFKGCYSAKDIIDKIDSFGTNIQSNLFEAAGTIQMGETLHWVNVIGIKTYNHLHLFGGGHSARSLFRIWNPINGRVSFINATSVTNIKVFSF